MDNNIILYILGGIVGIVAGLKACDWLISLKYKTKEDCEICRNAITKTINKEGKILTVLNTKMDLLLEHLKITVGGDK